MTPGLDSSLLSSILPFYLGNKLGIFARVAKLYKPEVDVNALRH